MRCTIQSPILCGKHGVRKNVLCTVEGRLPSLAWRHIACSARQGVASYALVIGFRLIVSIVIGVEQQRICSVLQGCNGAGSVWKGGRGGLIKGGNQSVQWEGHETESIPSVRALPFMCNSLGWMLQSSSSSAEGVGVEREGGVFGRRRGRGL